MTRKPRVMCIDACLYTVVQEEGGNRYIQVIPDIKWIQGAEIYIPKMKSKKFFNWFTKAIAWCDEANQWPEELT